MGDGGGFGPEDAPVLEATALIAALATATERVRLGSLVFGTTYRHPAVLANWAATVDQLSGGRLVLGIGAGWQENEHAQYGLELPPVRARVDRFAEVCQVTRSLFENPTTDFDGEWFHLTGAYCEPKPVQSPLPLLIGAKGDRMIGLAASYADEWNMWGLPDALAERMAVLDAACERIDRDPAGVARSTQALVMLTEDTEAARGFVESMAPRATLAGTPSPDRGVSRPLRRGGDRRVDRPRLRSRSRPATTRGTRRASGAVRPDPLTRWHQNLPVLCLPDRAGRYWGDTERRDRSRLGSVPVVLGLVGTLDGDAQVVGLIRC